MPLQKIHIRFRQIRQETGLSQIDFAIMARLKQSQVSQIETGARDISDAIYLALEHHLHVNRPGLEKGEGDLFTDRLIVDQIRARNIHPVTPRPNKLRPRSSLKSLNIRNHAGKLKYFRKLLKKNAEQMARELKVNPPTYSKYENGLIAIPVEVPMYLHATYDMSYEWFFDDKGEWKVAYPAAFNGQQTLDQLYKIQLEIMDKITELQTAIKK